jgi:SAM-dependent methyltransferase
MSDIKSIWSIGINDEADFQGKWLRSGGLYWKDEFDFRMDPNAPLQEDIAKYTISGIHELNILDVGAGPLTSIGKIHPDPSVKVNITAVDALADVYERQLRDAGIVPLVKTVKCETETLTSMFETAYDITHAKNCIDHHYDPMAAIRQMALVTKTGGVVILHHRRKEAEVQNWHGLHQWNLYVEGGSLFLTRPDDAYHVEEALADLMTLEETKQEEDWDWAVFRRV